MTITVLEPSALRGKKFRLDTLPEESGRVSIYEPPRQGRHYTIGADFAYGLEGGDWDAGCVFDQTAIREGNPAQQVAEVQGKWGEKFDTILYALHTYYNGAFLLGERQVGLATLRRLWDKYDLRFMYRQQAVDKAAVMEGANPTLGWHSAANDVTVAEFRRAVKDRAVELRSPQLIEQMGRLQFVAPGSRSDDRQPDSKLKLKLSGGGSPDLARAAAYGYYALSLVHHFEQERPKPQPLAFYGPPIPEPLRKALEPKKQGGPQWVPGTV